MAQPRGPLEGVKVVACSTAQAGTVPYVLMVDLGAEVIKIEPPAVGDSSRRTGHMPGLPSPYFETNNWGVQSLTNALLSISFLIGVLMERIPRVTKATKPMFEAIANALWDIGKDPIFQAAFRNVSLAPTPENMGKLKDVIRERHPVIAAQLGVSLDRFVATIVREKRGEPGAFVGQPIELEWLTPDNPIKRQLDGSLIVPARFFTDYSDAEQTKYLRQQRDYERALRDPRQRGRPPTATPRPSSTRSINEVDARIAAEMHNDGKDKWDIAGALNLVQRPLPKNRNTRKRILQRVSRIVERGQILQKIIQPKKSDTE